MRYWYGQRKVTLDEFGDCPFMNDKDIGEILGLTPQRIRQLTKKGFPRAARGHYPMRGCIHWYIGYLKSCGFVRKRSKTKERLAHLRLKLLEVRVQQITGAFVEREVIEGRKYLVKLLDRQLSRLPWDMARELNWTREQTLAVRNYIDAARNAVVGESEEFITEQFPSGLRDRRG